MQTQIEDEDLAPTQIMNVKVVNGNDFPILDRFDGIAYAFPAGGKAVSIPLDAANHIFGWHPPYTNEHGAEVAVDPEAMRRHMMKRFGWNTPDLMKEGAHMTFTNNIIIAPIVFRMVPVEVDQNGDPDQTPKGARAPKAKPSDSLMHAVDEAQLRHANKMTA